MHYGWWRSPTGECIGWHSLAEEESQEKLKQYQENQTDKEWIRFG